MKRFKTEKLIRDNLPNILNTKGIVLQNIFLEEKEFIAKLKNKVLEEANEIIQSHNTEELAEELSDMLELIHTLSKASGLNMDHIEKLRIDKLKTKGGFEKKTYCQFVDIDENNPSINKYLAKPEQYSLVEEPLYKPGCLFCQFVQHEKEVKIFESFDHCYAIKDQFPVSKGHVLIISNEHTENWFTAKEFVRQDMMKALHFLKTRLDFEYNPQGYNVGANCGATAGQTIMHLHLHLIPRYQGDTENPRGGVRGVIPSKQKY